MTGFLDFLPLAAETIASIRARMDADANAGIDPSDEAFIDTVVGGFYWDMTHPAAIELERLYEFISTEAASAMFPAFAFGEYLDLWGETLGLPRKDAVKATGTITFTGTNGTLVPTGAKVSQPQIDPDINPISFVTTEAGVVAGGTLTLAAEAEEPGAAGNVAAGTVTLLLTGIVGISATTNPSAMTGGTDVESDELYQPRILLDLASSGSGGNIADFQRWCLAYPGVGYVTVTPVWAGPGTVRCVITDSSNSPVGASVVSGLQAKLDPPRASTTLNNGGPLSLPAATITVPSTAGFLTGGTYRFVMGGQSITYTGTTGTTFTGCSGGTGTVADGTAITQGGRGEGLAPIGSDVVVATPATVSIDVYAEITFATGYDLDGLTGLIALRPLIESAIRDYIDKLPPGGSVYFNHVEAQIFRVDGVLDVANVKINGGTSNISITGLQVARTRSTVRNKTNGSQNLASLPGNVLTVDSTTGFPSSGAFFIDGQYLTYSGTTGTTFTGVSVGTGTKADDTPVGIGILLK